MQARSRSKPVRSVKKANSGLYLAYLIVGLVIIIGGTVAFKYYELNHKTSAAVTTVVEAVTKPGVICQERVNDAYTRGFQSGHDKR